jgi:hypothetical protein
MKKRDLTARVIGLTAFALGIAILIFSFIKAYGFFATSVLSSALARPDSAPVTANLSNTAILVVVKIGALFIMVLVGSVIAARGVQMYFAGERMLKVEE